MKWCPGKELCRRYKVGGGGAKQQTSGACLPQTRVFTDFSAHSHTQLHFQLPHQRERPQKCCCRGKDMQHHTSNVSWCESACRKRCRSPRLLTHGNKLNNWRNATSQEKKMELDRNRGKMRMNGPLCAWCEGLQRVSKPIDVCLPLPPDQWNQTFYSPTRHWCVWVCVVFSMICQFWIMFSSALKYLIYSILISSTHLISSHFMLSINNSV